jgi:hypothetical protein
VPARAKWQAFYRLLDGLASEGASHCVFVRADGQTLPVPAHRPIKPVYVKKFVALVRGD